MSPTPAADFLARLEVVRGRLRGLAEVGWSDGLTDPDPPTGERWEWGQVWAHTAEFIPYWLDQVASIVAAPGEGPAPFGRTKSDQGRLAAIERDRGAPVSELWSRIDGQIEDLRSTIEDLLEADWERSAAHPTLGTMTVAEIVDEFLVGHLEQHADQLDGLRRAG